MTFRIPELISQARLELLQDHVEGLGSAAPNYVTTKNLNQKGNYLTSMLQSIDIMEPEFLREQYLFAPDCFYAFTKLKAINGPVLEEQDLEVRREGTPPLRSASRRPVKCGKATSLT